MVAPSASARSRSTNTPPAWSATRARSSPTTSRRLRRARAARPGHVEGQRDRAAQRASARPAPPRRTCARAHAGDHPRDRPSFCRSARATSWRAPGGPPSANAAAGHAESPRQGTCERASKHSHAGSMASAGRSGRGTATSHRGTRSGSTGGCTSGTGSAPAVRCPSASMRSMPSSRSRTCGAVSPSPRPASASRRCRACCWNGSASHAVSAGSWSHCYRLELCLRLLDAGAVRADRSVSNRSSTSCSTHVDRTGSRSDGAVR